MIERIRAEIGEPGAPRAARLPGVDIELAGLPVIAAAAAVDLLPQPLLVDAGGPAAVALVLFAVYRSLPARHPAGPWWLPPSGWSALVLRPTGIPPT